MALDMGLPDRFCRKRMEDYLLKNGDYSIRIVCSNRAMDIAIEHFPYHSNRAFCIAIVQVNGDGACQFTSLWVQLCFSDDKEEKGAKGCDTITKKKFTPYRLRLMAVYLMIQRCRYVSSNRVKCVTIVCAYSNRVGFIAIVHFLQDDRYKDRLVRYLAGEYAWTNAQGEHEGDHGPFSLESYFQ